MSIEFDTGPLTWVKGEIDLALQQAQGKLAQFSEDASDSTPLRLAQTHLHQVTGAIQMVGLDGAAKFGEAIEKMVSALEKHEIAISGANLAAVGSALSTLSQYLENLLNGKPDQPVRLFPQYEALQRARGVEKISESELFFPDISIRAPKNLPTRSIPERDLPTYLKSARTKYQRGLLGYLKNQSDNDSLNLMRDALEAIEQTQSSAAQKTFWWTTVGLIESLTNKGIAPVAQIKLLCGGIDQQIRRLVEGSPKVAERLLRDTLYFVARSAPVADRVRNIQEQFELSSYLPGSSSAEQQNEEEVARRQPILRELRELILPAKEAWLRYTAGNVESLKILLSQLKRLVDQAKVLDNTPLDQLLGQIGHLATRLDSDPANLNESIAMEMATALLLAENSLQRYQGVTDEFTRQSEVVCKRLQACQQGTLSELDVPEIELLDEISRKAQEKLLLAQVGQEILSNLQHIEQTLDTFFRDPAQREDLPGLKPYLKQIYGALKILDLEPAVSLLDECERLVDGFCQSDYQADQAQMELAAEGLSSLGFYVEAIQRDTADADKIITSALSHLNPLYAVPSTEMLDSPLEATAEVEEPDVSSIESGLDAQKAKTQELLLAWQQNPASNEAKQAFAKQVSNLQQDADLVADEALKAQAGQAKILTEADAPSSELNALLSQICAPKVAMEAPSEASAKLAQEEDETIDAEMLEIFLEEAVEVLGAIGENLAVVQSHPHDKEALTTLRRSFHTLKGSGRMVGLWDLGEVAWGVEQVMNKWLQEEKNATPELLDIISRAHQDFLVWVEGLKTRGSVRVEAADLLADAEQLRTGITKAELAPGAPAEQIDAVQGVEVEQVLPETTAPALDLAVEMGDTFEMPHDVIDSELELGEVISEPQFSIEDLPAAIEAEITISEQELEPEPEPEPLQDLIESIAETPELDISLDQASEITLAESEIEEADNIGSESAPQTDEVAEGTLPETLLETQIEVVEAPPEVVVESEIEIPSLTAEEIEVVEEAQEPVVQVGELLLPSELYKIFVGEANQHLATLEQHMNLLNQNTKQQVQHDFMRAAHTLCGISRTVGFANVAELAFPLEACLLDLLENHAQASEDQRKVMNDAINSLSGMVKSIADTHAPDPAPHLISALQDMLKQAIKTRTAPVAKTIEPTPAPVTHIVQNVIESVAPPAHAEHERDRRAIRDDIDYELLPIFLEEAHDLFPLVGNQLRAWRADLGDTQSCANLQRALHTIKGSARMAGAMRLGELTHNMETQVVSAAESGNIPDGLFDTLDSEFDRMADVLDHLEKGTEQAPIEVPSATSAGEPTTVAAVAAAITEPEVTARAMLRIRADVVDRLVSEAGEVSIARSRIEGEMQGFKRSLLELTESINRLRNQLREIEIQAESQMQSRQSLAADTHSTFDPLEFDRFTRLQEVTRMMAESVNDVASVQHNLLKNLDETDAALLAQSRMTKELQQELLRARMIPLSSISERLYRIVRQTSKELGKRASLEILGDQVELDRSVLEKMTAPFEHLLRNAIDHGLETRESRLAAGKEETGTITLQARQEGNEIQLSLKDDGRGINLERVRAKAIDLGLIQAETEVTPGQLTEMIFAPGFSTAAEVTQVSGRGIGMDVVRNEIASLGGRVEVTTTQGGGTQFSIYLPLTLAVTQTIMVRSGNHIYALPSTMVDQVQEFKAGPLAEIYEKQQINWQGNTYPLFYLPRLLGDETTLPVAQRYTMIILLHSGPQRVAIHVDELMGNREVVVKNIGPQLARVPGISGATVLGNGQVVLILNPVQLGLRYSSLAIQSNRQATPIATAQPVSTPIIMIVDDSLTVRKITSKLLVREGYEVVTAKDGVDALQMLEEMTPQVMLVDIEMPRMDGFELTKNIRASAKTANIPIIMITSRTAEKHRNYARELGVNVYLGKPYQEDELLGHIAGFVKG
jgi:chemosensory pili system protein ChpA (sensor histidine kinase/response regulator)